MNKYNLIQSMTFLLALVVLPGSQFVNATPIDPNITISGGTTFDNDISSGPSFSFGTTTGGMTNTVGGESTTTTVAGSSATGANPLNSTLTHTGDGYSIDGSGNASANGEEFAMGFDNSFTVTNSSATSTYDVVLKLVYSNWVESSGADAYAVSEFTVDEDGTEIFFSYLVSDTVNGNEKGDFPTGSSGGPVSESGTELISITLTAADSIDFDLIWTLEGGNFADGGAAAFNSSFDLSIESVTDPSAVPIPGAVVLFGTGLFGLLGLTRKRKTIVT